MKLLIEESVLRQALEAYDHINETGLKPSVCAGVQRAFHNLRAALNAPQPEPVGWWLKGTRLMEPHKFDEDCVPLCAAPAIPAGWKLVPEEPTEAILDVLYSNGMDEPDLVLVATYKAMLAAAPSCIENAEKSTRSGDVSKESTDELRAASPVPGEK